MSKNSMTLPTRICLAAVALASPACVLVPDAHAAGCDTITGSGDHYAYIQEYGNQCTWIQVRHRSDPVWSANNYYTAWAGGTGSYYRDERAPSLLWAEGYAY